MDAHTKVQAWGRQKQTLSISRPIIEHTHSGSLDLQYSLIALSLSVTPALLLLSPSWPFLYFVLSLFLCTQQSPLSFSFFCMGRDFHFIEHLNPFYLLFLFYSFLFTLLSFYSLCLFLFYSPVLCSHFLSFLHWPNSSSISTHVPLSLLFSPPDPPQSPSDNSRIDSADIHRRRMYAFTLTVNHTHA